MTPRLLVIASHPIQYQAPWFRALNADPRIDLKVLFLCLPDAHQQGVDFGQAFEWDVPLLEGFDWSVAGSATGMPGAGWTGLRLRNPVRDIRAQRASVVMVLGWHYLGMAQCIRAAAKLDLPVLVRGDSNGLAPISLLSRIRNRHLLRNVGSFAVVGTANRIYYERLGLGHKCSADVPHIVDNHFFHTNSSRGNLQREELRKSLGVPEGALCFLFAGKLQEKKRPDDLLSAMDRASARTPKPIHLLMVGAGPMERTLKRQSDTGRIPVSFAGFRNQTEMPAAYAAADCLVLPSDYGETWGLVVNEAMACGLPAIISDRVGCGLDLVTDGETGFRFRFGDVEHLAQRVAEMAMLDESERKAMGERARKTVLTRFSIEQAVAGTVAATLELLGEGQGVSAH